MISFILELAKNASEEQTVIVMDQEGYGTHQQYRLRPRWFLKWFLGIVVLFVVVLFLLFLFLPIRDWLLPGQGATSIQQQLTSNTDRLIALQDSLEIQQLYITRLQQFVLESNAPQHIPTDSSQTTQSEQAPYDDLFTDRASPLSDDWQDHIQPAFPIERISVKAPPVDSYLSGLRLPVMPPVSGFITRNFDARTGHYGVDIALDEGTTVRTVGDGYVVFADWTHQTGYSIIVQHAGGYASMYKHNMRLLKQVGDHVKARDAIAITGNSGEITTGPHLHFELWHEGLAQDPRPLMIGW